MFKKSKIAICLLCMVSLVVMIPFDSKASNVYNVGYAEPATSDSEGYCSVLWRNNSTGAYSVHTYFWYCAAMTNSALGACYMNITVTPSTINFNPGGYQANTSAFYSLSLVDASGNYINKKYSSSESFTDSYAGYSIVTFMYSGNVGVVNCQISIQPFEVHFSTDKSQEYLMQIYGELVNLNTISIRELPHLTNIYNQSVSANEKLNAIYSNFLPEFRKTNELLEDIRDYLKNSPEQEKQEATTQGNSSVSSGISSIDDKGASFGESLSGLVSSLSYSGTDCSWTFPQVKLPVIPGVMSETVLIQEQPINFGEWINKIPGDILLLIQSFSTCALIVYCFKELYSTISYALTLKGGGADE